MKKKHDVGIGESLKPWTVEGSRHVLQDRWISVRADRCRTDEGTLVDPYYVIESPDWVHMAVFDDEQRILINRLYRHGNREMSYEIPAGMMDAGESDPLVSARRELLEETGYASDSFQLLSSLTPNSARFDNSIHNYLVTHARFEGVPEQDDSEQIESGFVPVQDVLQWIQDGTFRQSTQIATIFMALQELKWIGWVRK